jgi:hypothetical protein
LDVVINSALSTAEDKKNKNKKERQFIISKNILSPAGTFGSEPETVYCLNPKIDPLTLRQIFCTVRNQHVTSTIKFKEKKH